MGGQAGDHGVADVAHPALQRQELRRDPARRPSRRAGTARRGRRSAGSSRRPRRSPGRRRARWCGRRPTTLAGSTSAYRLPIRSSGSWIWIGLAVRGRRQDDDVGQLADPRRVIGVELDDHPVGLLQERRGVADPGRQVDPAVGGDVGRLDDRHVHPAEEALHDHLRDVREVHVHEVEPARVRQLPERARGHVGARQLTASAWPSSSSQAAPVEAPLSSRIWNGSPASCSARARAASAAGHRLGRPGRGEAAHPDHRAMGDQLRRLFGGQRRETNVPSPSLCAPRLRRQPLGLPSVAGSRRRARGAGTSEERNWTAMVVSARHRRVKHETVSRRMSIRGEAISPPASLHPG